MLVSYKIAPNWIIYMFINYFVPKGKSVFNINFFFNFQKSFSNSGFKKIQELIHFYSIIISF